LQGKAYKKEYEENFSYSFCFVAVKSALWKDHLIACFFVLRSTKWIGYKRIETRLAKAAVIAYNFEKQER